MMKQVCCQTPKPLAAECLDGVHLGLPDFLISGLCGLIVGVQVAVCFGHMSLAQFLDLSWWIGA